MESCVSQDDKSIVGFWQRVGQAVCLTWRRKVASGSDSVDCAPSLCLPHLLGRDGALTCPQRSMTRHDDDAGTKNDKRIKSGEGKRDGEIDGQGSVDLDR